MTDADKEKLLTETLQKVAMGYQHGVYFNDDGKAKVGEFISTHGLCAVCGFKNHHKDCYVKKALEDLEPCDTSVMVNVGHEHYHDLDEAYGNWYKCPNCKGHRILDYYSYCPECGAKVNWKIPDGER